MTDQPQTLCRTCATPIGYVDCPTGSWWAHETHPADEHDAVPGAWVDGDPLMETIAAEVWEHCAGEGTSLIVDDPRNIAGTAAAAARRMLAPAVPAVPVSSPPPDQTALRQRIAEAVQDGPTWMLPRSLSEEVADAVLAVLPPPADRAAVLREAAEVVHETTAPASWTTDSISCWNTATNIAESKLRRLAAEAPQPDTETRP